MERLEDGGTSRGLVIIYSQPKKALWLDMSSRFLQILSVNFNMYLVIYKESCRNWLLSLGPSQQ